MFEKENRLGKLEIERLKQIRWRKQKYIIE